VKIDQVFKRDTVGMIESLVRSSQIKRKTLKKITDNKIDKGDKVAYDAGVRGDEEDWGPLFGERWKSWKECEQQEKGCVV